MGLGSERLAPASRLMREEAETILADSTGGGLATLAEMVPRNTDLAPCS